MSDPLLSRKSVSDPDGTCSVRLDTLVTAELFDRLGALAALDGMNRSEYVRMVRSRHVYGEFCRIQRIVRAGRDAMNGTNGG